MMNGPLVDEQAAKLGRTAANDASQSVGKAISKLYRSLFAREPAPDEMALGKAFIAAWTPTEKVSNPWQAYAHALLSSNEFIFID